MFKRGDIVFANTEKDVEYFSAQFFLKYGEFSRLTPMVVDGVGRSFYFVRLKTHPLKRISCFPRRIIQGGFDDPPDDGEWL